MAKRDADDVALEMAVLSLMVEVFMAQPDAADRARKIGFLLGQTMKPKSLSPAAADAFALEVEAALQRRLDLAKSIADQARAERSRRKPQKK